MCGCFWYREPSPEFVQITCPVRASKACRKMPMNGQMPAAKYTVPSATTGPPRAGQVEMSRSLPSTLRSDGPPRNFHARLPRAISTQ